jgi:pilus assembly protein Flp/PilA
MVTTPLSPCASPKGFEMKQFLHNLCGDVRQFLVSEDGPTSVEYAVMLAFIFLACIAGVTAVGQVTLGLYTDSSEAIDAIP